MLNAIFSALGFPGIAFVDALVTSLAANTASSDGNTITANANGALGSLDGVTPAVGTVIGYFPGSARDGVYEVTSLGAGDAPWVMRRAEGFRSGDTYARGFLVYALQGTSNARAINHYHASGGITAAVTLNTTTTTMKMIRQNAGLASYTDTSGTPGSATAHTGAGRSAIALGASACTITNNFVGTTSVVVAQLEDLDGTATRLKVVPGAGSFVVTADANATAATKFRWYVVTPGT